MYPCELYVQIEGTLLLVVQQVLSSEDVAVSRDVTFAKHPGHTERPHDGDVGGLLPLVILLVVARAQDFDNACSQGGKVGTEYYFCKVSVQLRSTEKKK